MYGLEAIAAYNGWAQALAGACIVMTGLSVLSFLISQLHRIVGFVEAKKDEGAPVEMAATVDKTDVEVVPDKPSSDLNEAVDTYKTFADKLGSSFKLSDLYRLSAEADLPHPHLSIKGFREEGLLVPDKDDLFSWKSQSKGE